MENFLKKIESARTKCGLPLNRVPGFSIFEVILALAIFMVVIAGVVPFYLSVFDSNLKDGDKLRADTYLQQGLEAVRSIRDQDFGNLVNGTYGLSKTSGYWAFNGNNDTWDKFTRTVVVGDVKRDDPCNVTSAVGNVDSKSKQVTVTVSWQYKQGNPTQISTTEYLTDWQHRGGCEQSSNLIINLSGAYLSSDDKRIAGITLENIGPKPIAIDKIKMTWTNSALMEEIKIASDIVWKYNNTGLPKGKQPSGTEFDIVNATLAANSGVVQLDHFFFNDEMEGITFTIYFTMADGSVRYEHVDNLQ